MTMFADKLCVRETVVSPVNSVISGAKCENSFEVLTLDNMWDHQSRTGVITSQTSRGNILFDLEGKQVPVHKHRPFSESQQGSVTKKEIWNQRSHLKSENFTQDNTKVTPVSLSLIHAKIS